MPDYSAKRPSDKLKIESTFISAVLKDTAELIQSRQRQVAEDWGLFESGDLKRSLQGHFSVANMESGGHLTMRYLTYARWLDMQNPNRKVKKEGYHLYNRIVFGVLYNPTVNALRFGLTDDIRTLLSKKIKDIYDQKVPFYKINNLVVKEISNYDKNYAAIMRKV